MQHRTVTRVTHSLVLPALLALAASSAGAAFHTQRLVLRQGDVPTLNGVPIPGAPVYTGVEDTYVFRDTPDTNYVGADTLHCFNSHYVAPTAGLAATRAYLRFNGFSAELPAGATILNAAVQVTSGGREGPGDPLFVNYRTADWDAATITYNTAGGWSSNVRNMGGVMRDSPFAAGTTAKIDVSSLSRAWAGGSVANYGLQLNAPEPYSASYPDYLMYSSDHATAGNRPQLIIDYIDPATVVEVGGQGCSVSSRILQGTAAFADTIIENSTTTYAAATDTGTLQLRNPATAPRPRRALIKVLMDNPDLADLAPTGTPLTPGTKVLGAARLEFNIIGGARGSIRLATAAQDWDDAFATGAGGTSGNGYATAGTEWAQPWGVALTNYATNLGLFAYDPTFQAGTQSFDITTQLQSYLDGGSNFGFILDPNTDYGSQWALTGYAAAHMQPTLVLEVLTVIPEPAALGLGVVLAALVCTRRHRIRCA